jgi:hypothetical protein
LWSEFCRVPSRWLHLLRFRLDAGFFESRSNIIGERDIASVWKQQNQGGQQGGQQQNPGQQTQKPGQGGQQGGGQQKPGQQDQNK